MNLENYVNATYLKVEDLETARIWHITGVREEKDKEDEKKQNLILDIKFSDIEKAFQLNQTNLKRCIEVFGKESDNLIGRKIILKTVETEYKGKQKIGIRIDEVETTKHNFSKD